MYMEAKHHHFCKEYVACGFNGTEAYLKIWPHVTRQSAGTMAHELLKNLEIQQRIQEIQENAAAAAELDTNWVLRRWRELAEADPSELTQLRRVCCRHCHGVGHAYQWTAGEYRECVREATLNGAEAPACPGGFGFDVNAKPNPECPECGGEGRARVHLFDTRELKGRSKGLYKGVKETRNGIEVMVHDQLEAVRNIATFLGMTKQQVAVIDASGARGLAEFYNDARQPGE